MLKYFTQHFLPSHDTPSVLSTEWKGKAVQAVLLGVSGLWLLPVSTSGGFPSWIISLHSCSSSLPVSSGAGAVGWAGGGGGGGGGGVSSNDKRDKSLSVWS